jgi:hypothetical protein
MFQLYWTKWLSKNFYRITQGKKRHGRGASCPSVFLVTLIQELWTSTVGYINMLKLMMWFSLRFLVFLGIIFPLFKNIKQIFLRLITFDRYNKTWWILHIWNQHNKVVLLMYLLISKFVFGVSVTIEPSRSLLTVSIIPSIYLKLSLGKLTWGFKVIPIPFRIGFLRHACVLTYLYLLHE